MLKEIHQASKDLNKELKEFNYIPFFTYIFFFIVFSILHIKKYLNLLLFKQHK